MENSFVLRDYQDSIIVQNIRAFRNLYNLLIVAPTGSGKTHLARCIAQLILNDNSNKINKVVILSANKNIVNSFRNKKDITYMSHNILSMSRGLLVKEYDKDNILNKKSLRNNSDHNIFTYCYQSITNENANNYDIFEYISDVNDCSHILLIIDEAHHLGYDEEETDKLNKLRCIVDNAYDKHARLLFLTATPFTRKGRLSFNKYGSKDFCVPLSVLIANGHCPKIEIHMNKVNFNPYNDAKNMAYEFYKSYPKSHPKCLVVIRSTKSIDEDGTTEEMANEFIRELNKLDNSITCLNSLGKNGIEKVDLECSHKTYHNVTITCPNGRYREGTDDNYLCCIYLFGKIDSSILFTQLLGRVLRKKSKTYPHKEYINTSLMEIFIEDNVDDLEFARLSLGYVIKSEDPFSAASIPPFNCIHKLNKLKEKTTNVDELNDIDDIIEEFNDYTYDIENTPIDDKVKCLINNKTCGNTLEKIQDSIDVNEDKETIDLSKKMLISRLLNENEDEIIDKIRVEMKNRRKRNESKLDIMSYLFDLAAEKYKNEEIFNNSTIMTNEVLVKYAKLYEKSQKMQDYEIIQYLIDNVTSFIMDDMNDLCKEYLKDIFIRYWLSKVNEGFLSKRALTLLELNSIGNIIVEYNKNKVLPDNEIKFANFIVTAKWISENNRLPKLKDTEIYQIMRISEKHTRYTGIQKEYINKIMINLKIDKIWKWYPL